MFMTQEDYNAAQDEAFWAMRGCELIRGCPRHPGEVTSNGMFDAPCGACESEIDDNADEG